MEIMNMMDLNKTQLFQATQILSESLPLGWPDYESAAAELKERLKPNNTLLAAVSEGEVICWGGLLEAEYGGNVFELHPLVVKGNRRRQGVGRKILKALEQAAKEQGGLTIYLGADDEKEECETSLAHVDLYHNLPEKLADFNPGTHQAAFYLKMGYQLIGVLPDANGKGKPDLFFGKSLCHPAEDK